ncbi:MAG: hypothetical protein ACRD4B_07980, partial [Acidobacteriota bacterium]
IEYLLTNVSIDSIPGLNAGKAEEVEDFSRPLDREKLNGTLHIPGSEYALPQWAGQYRGVACQIIEFEHATNPRADQQVAFIRVRQSDEPLGDKPAHIEILRPNVRNYHLYLVTDESPTITFDGKFTYTPNSDIYNPGDPRPFFHDLSDQFDTQAEQGLVAAHQLDPFEITALAAHTVHKRGPIQPGRTLLGIEFYEVAS